MSYYHNPSTPKHRKPGIPAIVTEYHCKHCKVQVIGKSDFRPVLGKEHKKSCPRARTLN